MNRSRGIFLCGNSYPKDRHVETELGKRMAPTFSMWNGQQDINEQYAAGEFQKDINARLAILRRIVPNKDIAEDVVLIGRSSGARIGTLFACQQPVKAVICLGYPFRVPGRAAEPKRFEHLARMRTPTLILQGRSDGYGGSSILADYTFSDCVTINFLDCGHEFRIDSQGWNTVAETISTFLALLDGPARKTSLLEKSMIFLRRFGH